MKVKYGNFGKSSSIIKLYAIKDSKQTIVTFTLASSWDPLTQKTDHDMANIKIIGNIIL